MKFNCGLSGDEYHEWFTNWHDHFAWIPRRVGSRDCRWLETIERKGTQFVNPTTGWIFCRYEYRAKEKP